MSTLTPSMSCFFWGFTPPGPIRPIFDSSAYLLCSNNVWLSIETVGMANYGQNKPFWSTALTVWGKRVTSLVPNTCVSKSIVIVIVNTLIVIKIYK